MKSSSKGKIKLDTIPSKANKVINIQKPVKILSKINTAINTIVQMPSTDVTNQKFGFKIIQKVELFNINIQMHSPFTPNLKVITATKNDI